MEEHLMQTLKNLVWEPMWRKYPISKPMNCGSWSTFGEDDEEQTHKGGYTDDD